jgi:hypothetical protein
MLKGFSKLLAPAMAAATIAIGSMAAATASAETLAGVYRGFLAFDFKGKEVREWMMVSFNADGTMIFGAEEAHDEPVDPATGVVTKNDFESANLGLWRAVGDTAMEFGTQQYRAGSAFCKPVNQHPEGLLPTCSFVITARLSTNVTVRGATCDLGGTKGALAVQAVDGSTTVTNPFNLGIRLDYCLQKMSVDKFMALAPLD